jgi:hypothetical protein
MKPITPEDVQRLISREIASARDCNRQAVQYRRQPYMESVAIQSRGMAIAHFQAATRLAELLGREMHIFRKLDRKAKAKALAEMPATSPELATAA